jgi:hypothetical protein
MSEQKTYDNNNEIAIWENKRRNKPTDPDFQGNATIDGKEYWVSAWKRSEDSSDRAPVLKLKVTPKTQQSQPMTPPSQGNPVDLDKEIPF